MIVKYLKKLQQSIENDRELLRIAEKCGELLRIVIVLWPPLGQAVCSFFLVTVPVGEKAQSYFPSLLEQFTSQQLIVSQEVHNRIVRRGH